MSWSAQATRLSQGRFLNLLTPKLALGVSPQCLHRQQIAAFWTHYTCWNASNVCLHTLHLQQKIVACAHTFTRKDISSAYDMISGLRLQLCFAFEHCSEGGMPTTYDHSTIFSEHVHGFLLGHQMWAQITQNGWCLDISQRTGVYIGSQVP